MPTAAAASATGQTAQSEVTATLLIATYNRAPFLEDTLASIAALRTPAGVAWDVLIVDNNSTDATPDVVSKAAGSFPVPLRYLFEPRQGKSIALNTALSAISSSIILFTDDDVRLPPDWIDAAVSPLIARPDIAYVGGPVRPLWEGNPPQWLKQSTRSSGVLAVLDYGTEPFSFEDRGLIPVGVNMAVRRSVVEQVGGFHTALDRSGTTLLGQGQAEFFARCRRAGARGLYVPQMGVDHLVPANRLSLSYFFRWWYWKGVSHARWYRMHNETELGVDLSHTGKVLGIPRFILGEVVRECVAGARAVLGGRLSELPDHLVWLAFVAGYVREVWFGPREVRAQVRPGIQTNVPAP